MLIVDPGELEAAISHGPRAWAGVGDSHYIRIVASGLTGRRVRVEPGGVAVTQVDPEGNGS